MPRRGLISGLFLLGLVVFSLLYLAGQVANTSSRTNSGRPGESIDLGEAMAIDLAGYAVAAGPRRYEFPKDHGPHPDYRTEWWYFTGNLKSEEGNEFGYQLTFFRTALTPPDPNAASRESVWATRQMYMAHFALSDLSAQKFHAFERFGRGAAGLAGAEINPLRVWLDDWKIESVAGHSFPLRLRAREGEIEIDLILETSKGVVLQGDSGYSPKDATGTSASYYYSDTRLQATGQVRVGDLDYRVSGTSWFDHEFGSGALGRTQSGWDWFCIQLDDGRDVMVAQVRASDGSEPFRGGMLVEPGGETLPFDPEQIELRVTNHWRSPASEVNYPSAWVLTLDEADLQLEIHPAMADQEMPLAIRYWEGSTRISGQSRGRDVSGVGYTELTGYGLGI
jgi:predicted secreted hydrolase